MRRRDLDELHTPDALTGHAVTRYQDDLLIEHDPGDVPTLLEQMAAQPTETAATMILGTPAGGERPAAWLAEWEAEFDAPAPNALGTLAATPAAEHRTASMRDRAY